MTPLSWQSSVSPAADAEPGAASVEQGTGEDG